MPIKILKTDKAKDLLEKSGTKVARTLSNKADCVVAAADAGSKLNKAKKLGVPVIDEAVALDLLK